MKLEDKGDYFFIQVTYQTDLFLDKNKDYVIAEHQALLSASKCSFVSSLFPPLSEDSSKSSKFSSIGSRFKVLGHSFGIDLNCFLLPCYFDMLVLL